MITTRKMAFSSFGPSWCLKHLQINLQVSLFSQQRVWNCNGREWPFNLGSSMCDTGLWQLTFFTWFNRKCISHLDDQLGDVGENTKFTSNKDNKLKLYEVLSFRMNTMKEKMQAFCGHANKFDGWGIQNHLTFEMHFTSRAFFFLVSKFRPIISQTDNSRDCNHTGIGFLFEKYTTLHDLGIRCFRSIINRADFRTEAICIVWVHFWRLQNSLSSLMIIYRWNITTPAW